MKYDLPDPYEMLNSPPAKLKWKVAVNKHVNRHWEENIKASAFLYSSLRFLNCSNFTCGKRHSLIKTLGNIREVPRVSTKLKLVTGTYILQTNRATFNQNQVNPVCLLCQREDETVSHFLLHCPALDSPDSFVQLLLDCSALTCFTNAPNNEQLHSVEFQSRRLCHALHCERYKLLALVPKRKRKKETLISR